MKVNFVNPYNFIPFSGKKPEKKGRREQYRGQEELKSGWIDVVLCNKTPLIIPDGAHPVYIDPASGKKVENPDEKAAKKLHKKCSFMKIDGKPIIPGSELRGLIRSVYETVTDSCMCVLMNDKPISQRVPAYSAMNKRGLLGKDADGKWVLYETSWRRKEIIISGDGRNARFVFKDNKKTVPDTGSRQPDGSYIQYNKPVSKDKPCYAVYLKPEKLIHKWKKDEGYEQLKEILDYSIKQKNGDANIICHEKLQSALKGVAAGNGELVPVFYFIVNRVINGKEDKLVYLSGSAIGRIAQHRKWKEIMGKYAPCDGPDYCPACLLFGNIGNKKKEGEGLKGHVRFSDGVYSGEKESLMKERTLEILSAPRPEAYEFYFRKPNDNAKYWNADFYSEQKRFQGKPVAEFHDLPESLPRGRKMYWHSEPKEKDAERDKMNSTMETLESGHSFKFHIYFDEITETQLKDMLWVITLGDNREGSDLLHKLGHAKPLGYGSVKLVVEKVTERKVKLGENEEIESIALVDRSDMDMAPASIKKDSKTVKSLLKMADIRSVGAYPVSYPHDDNEKDQAIYRWFSNNRWKSSQKQLKILPEPLDKDITLEGNFLKGMQASGEGKKPAVGKDKEKDGLRGLTAVVFQKDKSGTILLNKDDRLGPLPRIRKEDAGGRTFSGGEKIKVDFIEKKENEKGKLCSYYRLVED